MLLKNETDCRLFPLSAQEWSMPREFPKLGKPWALFCTNEQRGWKGNVLDHYGEGRGGYAK